MPFQKGNKISVGNKGGGRKPLVFEIGGYLEKEKQKLTDELLTGKAKDITMRVLRDMENKGGVHLEAMKGIVVPIALKGLVESKKLEVTLPQPILSEISKINVPSDNSNAQDNGTKEENTGGARGNVSIENSFDNPVPDTPSTE